MREDLAGLTAGQRALLAGNSTGKTSSLATEYGVDVRDVSRARRLSGRAPEVAAKVAAGELGFWAALRVAGIESKNGATALVEKQDRPMIRSGPRVPRCEQFHRTVHTVEVHADVLDDLHRDLPEDERVPLWLEALRRSRRNLARVIHYLERKPA